MSKRVYRTANGKVINIDTVIAQNEDSIAVGNMKVNARGDELGHGGKIERTREKVMAEYYKLNTPVASDHIPIPKENKQAKKDLMDEWEEPVVVKKPEPVEDSAQDVKVEVAPLPKNIRGSLANSVAKTQPAKEPEPIKPGPTRI